MSKHLLYLLLASLAGNFSFSQQTALEQYNIVWTDQSRNASESMPCGGGDIGMNVWVENGEVLIYLARSGSFNEHNALLKAGRLRIKLFPNPFAGSQFRQELKLQEGYITISGKHEGVEATLQIWADVFRPIVHIELQSNKAIRAEAAYESWRYRDRVVQPRENFGNSYKWVAPKDNVYLQDVISFDNNRVLFYHHNPANTIFDIIVTQQGLDSVKDQLYNPLAYRASGGLFSGKNFVSAGTYEGVYGSTDFKAWKLKSRSAAKQHHLQVTLHTDQVQDIALWKKSLDSLQQHAVALKAAKAASQQWWKQFWNRSFIHINKEKQSGKEWEIARNYQLFRYMLACNAHGVWPTKFNGGLFTFDPVFIDTAYRLTPDYRNWGGGLHTMQNQRLVYFPMIKSGDWDLLQSQLDFYLRILQNAELRSKVYWHHEGACFTEQMENFGLPNYAEYGTKRPPDFDKGLEYNAWLEYHWDTVLEFCLMMLEQQQYTGTDIRKYIPFIESCLRFFDEHYQYRARQRGRRSLDGDGKLILYPGSAAETYKMAYNATSTIAALKTVTERLLQLPDTYLSEETRKHWQSFLDRLPPVSFTQFNGHPTIAPAKLWERINNTESPQLYPVYPWGMYGVGKPGLDTAINTYQYDTNVVKFRSHIGWKQDAIWAARLGLTDEAWRLTSLKLQSAERRFPAFWGPGFDWVPDHNWGGSGMIGLQEMLLQVHDHRILLFPAWPKDKDVHFKLHAPYHTTVEAELKHGKIVRLTVLPAERAKDVEVMLK